jgi:hypothetical protein
MIANMRNFDATAVDKIDQALSRPNFVRPVVDDG